jgi:hypothetical protein
MASDDTRRCKVEPGLTCQHLYQSPSSPNARKGSYYQTSRNLYSYRLNYPAQLSMLIFRTPITSCTSCPRVRLLRLRSLPWPEQASPSKSNHENTKSERLAGSVTERMKHENAVIIEVLKHGSDDKQLDGRLEKLGSVPT